MGLTHKTIKIIQETAALVSANAENITQKMYEILFSTHPELTYLFDDTDANQHKKLAVAVSAYADNIENLGLLSKAVDKIAATHVRLSIKPEHYPIVGVSLLDAIKEILGDAATDEVLEAWKEAYFYLSDMLITREKVFYKERRLFLFG